MCPCSECFLDLRHADVCVEVDVSLEVRRAAFSNFFAIYQVLAFDIVNGLLFFWGVVVEREAPATRSVVVVGCSRHSELLNELGGREGLAEAARLLVLPRPRETRDKS